MKYSFKYVVAIGLGTETYHPPYQLHSELPVPIQGSLGVSREKTRHQSVCSIVVLGLAEHMAICNSDICLEVGKLKGW